MSWATRRPCSTTWAREVALRMMTLIPPRKSGPATPPATSTLSSARPERGAIRMHMPGGASAAMPVGTSPRPQ
eukprot:5980168-Pyramimonas_sp.AAC.1